jgi:hypothetical protein
LKVGCGDHGDLFSPGRGTRATRRKQAQGDDTMVLNR